MQFFQIIFMNRNTLNIKEESAEVKYIRDISCILKEARKDNSNDEDVMRRVEFY